MAVTNTCGSRRIAQGSPEVSPSETSQPLSKRVRIFEAIANLNWGFDRVLADVKLLRELGLFQYKAPSPFAETCRLTLEELRGWANFELTGALYQSAEEDWGRYGRLRLQWEEKHRDPIDVRLEAKAAKTYLQKAVGRKGSKERRGKKEVGKRSE
jgi:hypothetical protein